MPNMKRLTTVLAGCLAFVALHAQPVSESAPDPASVRKQLRNKEIGLRYGVQIGVGSGAPGQAMQYAAMDFAAYNYRNIGLRTGLNLFTSPLHDGQYASVPLQFSWRSGVRRMPTSSPDGYYYNGTWYPDRDMAAPSVGRTLFETFVPEVPSVFELHAGLTPGLLFGPIPSQDEGLYDIRQRFVCTADAGGRLNLPIGRVRLFIDFTYHYYLTRNFDEGIPRPDRVLDPPHRSFVGISGGLALTF